VIFNILNVESMTSKICVALVLVGAVWFSAISDAANINPVLRAHYIANSITLTSPFKLRDENNFRSVALITNWAR